MPVTLRQQLQALCQTTTQGHSTCIYNMSQIAHKSFKYRIYPTKEQANYLDQNFGAVRYIWNQFVNSFNHDFVGPTLPQEEKFIKDLPGKEWMKDVISYGLQQKKNDWNEFKKQFFSKARKSKVGKPKFKKRGVSNDSFRIPAIQLALTSFDQIKDGRIKLTKMQPMKIVIDRAFAGTPKSVTISKNKANQYFVSILVQENIELKQNTGRSIGIDLGLKDLAILSNGIKIANPRLFRKSQAKLKTAQQHLSKKVKGSNRYKKQKLKVAKIHLKITNQRKWIHHNLSTWLVTNYDTICMESLKVKNMVKNHKLAKSISDASWSSLVSMIEYKAKWYGKTFHQIDTWFPSSKTCSCCGHKVEKLPLSVREWTCPSCNTTHDRDLNAAVNILDKGLNDLYNLSSEELSDYKHREEISPLVLPVAHSMKCLVSFI